ncbi:hypothetical protein Ancab_011771 [Ancistrocladus abbreviatus]
MRSRHFRSSTPTPHRYNLPRHHSRTPSPPSHDSHHPHPRTPSPSSHHTFSESIVKKNMEEAEIIIGRWSYAHDSDYSEAEQIFTKDRREEAEEFIRVVNNLQSAMKYLVSTNSTSQMLVQGQNLLRMAMKRLEVEFRSLLKTNKQYLHPESLSTRLPRRGSSESFFGGSSGELSMSGHGATTDQEDDLRSMDNSGLKIERISIDVMNDLKLIADCMIRSGYSKECVEVYKAVRKSIVDEELCPYGMERTGSFLSHLQKMSWDSIELKIKNWLKAVKFANKTLFNGEKILSDFVFSSSAIRESCFTMITKDAAISLLKFPEKVAASSHKSLERIFRFLDMYEAIVDVIPELESMFSDKSTLVILLQAETSLAKLGEAIRAMLTEIELKITKDNDMTPVPRGGSHPLSRYVMNYLGYLSDYSSILKEILADYHLALQPHLPEDYFENPIGYNETDPSANLSLVFASMILLLLCKLDNKGKHYSDVALSYLYLMNNLHYIVNKVRNSNLEHLLGKPWLEKHEDKVRQYAMKFERIGWGKVISALDGEQHTEQAAEECFVKFNAAFDEAYRKQNEWVVADRNLRDEIKVAVAKKVVPKYREKYEKWRGLLSSGDGESVVKFAPEDLENYMSDLLFGSSHGGSGATTSTHSSSNSGGHRKPAMPSSSAHSSPLRYRNGR